MSSRTFSISITPRTAATALAVCGAALCAGHASGAAAAGNRTIRMAQVPVSCDAFGPGFVRVQGTNTCVRIGGRVRVEGSITSGFSGAWSPQPALRRRNGTVPAHMRLNGPRR